ncbi:hypothetical protein U1Q18_003491 [Sarracenia purpurea var. burkii]
MLNSIRVNEIFSPFPSEVCFPYELKGNSEPSISTPASYLTGAFIPFSSFNFSSVNISGNLSVDWTSEREVGFEFKRGLPFMASIPRALSERGDLAQLEIFD